MRNNEGKFKIYFLKIVTKDNLIKVKNFNFL